MNEYSYIAYDALGKKIHGRILARSFSDAKEKITSSELTVFSVNSAGVISKRVRRVFEKKPKPRELSVFCRTTANLLDAGVGIAFALSFLAEEEVNPVFKKKIIETELKIRGGESLAESFKYNSVFFGGNLFTAVISAGEESGDYAGAFRQMATHFERTFRLRNVIKNASIYPSVIAAVTIGVVAVLLAVVVPRFQDIFSQIGTELPALTKGVVAASDFIKDKWYILLTVVAMIFIGVTVFSNSETGKRRISEFILKLPAIKVFASKSASASAARTLSTLIAAGIPLIKSVEATADTMTNVVFAETLRSATKRIADGEVLSSSLVEKGKSCFPTLFLRMLKVGEESGKTDETLAKTAEYFEEEVEATSKQLMTFLEPLIIIIMAFFVIVIIMAIMLPIINMYGALDQI